jgi:hypothetical protein
MCSLVRLGQAASHTAVMQALSQSGAHSAEGASVGGLGHAKVGGDVRRSRPSGDDARHHRYRDWVSAQPHGVGRGPRLDPLFRRAGSQPGSRAGPYRSLAAVPGTSAARAGRCGICGRRRPAYSSGKEICLFLRGRSHDRPPNRQDHTAGGLR